MGVDGHRTDAKKRRLRRYVGWEEIVMSNDKGRRVVHYYLKDATGVADLAVVGREKSVRHMSYSVPDVFVQRLVGRSGGAFAASALDLDLGLPFKLRSRREVIDWLSSLVEESETCGFSPVFHRMNNEDAEPFKLPKFKVISSQKLLYDSKEFMWLGSSWTCSKRRNHYRSFSRNGVVIKVHDFIYVMTEENRRLVAYVEDLYEDLRGNNMVVVRWFHKVHEISTLLPPDVHDSEIFFSLCLQHLSVECIDGLASVLSAHHFEQFLNDGKLTKWQPYLCRKQIDNDDVKPFDVTHIQGYWSQEIIRSLFTSSLSSTAVEAGKPDISEIRSRSKSRLQLPKNSFVESIARDKAKLRDPSSDNSLGKISRGSHTGFVMMRKEQKHKLQREFSLGCHVEVLSEDSGIRGCWFHCVVIKRHQDRVKVRYCDVKNVDETGSLEEWFSLSRIASPDKLGIRLSGRHVVRPCPTQRAMNWSILDLGTNVDAWWHDGWWEGILVDKEDGLFRVYFPGEDQYSVFSHNDLRESREWVNEKWNLIEIKRDIASSVSFKMKSDNKILFDLAGIPAKQVIQEMPRTQTSPNPTGDITLQDECTASPDSFYQKGYCQDLTKDWCFDSLKWSSMKKRKRCKEFAKRIAPENKRPCKSSVSSGKDIEERSSYAGFLLPKSLGMDNENCKVGSDPLFNASLSLSSLVMSR